MDHFKRYACTPCKDNDFYVTAIKYCITCKERLCMVCADSHKAFKATRQHLLVQPDNQHPQKMIKDLELFQTCTTHSNKQTEFYCGEHDIFLCSQCLLNSENHKNCTTVVDIGNTGVSLDDGQFMANLKNGYHRMVEAAKSTLNDIKQAKACTGNNLKCLQNEIENIRRKMMEAFERQTNHIINAVSDDIVDNVSKYDTASESLENLLKLAEGSEALFQQAVEDGSPTDVFRCVKCIIGQCESLQVELEQTKHQCVKLKVAVEKSDLVRVLETDKTPLLSLSIEKTAFDIPVFCSDQLTKSFKSVISASSGFARQSNVTKHADEENQGRNPEASKTIKRSDEQALVKPIKSSHDLATTSDADIEREVEELSAGQHQTPVETKSDWRENVEEVDFALSYCCRIDVLISDEMEPWFNGIVCLPDERLILSDYNNSQLIMVKDKSVVTERRIENIPGNMTVFNEFLVVCLRDTNQLLFMKIEDTNLEENSLLQTQHFPVCVKTVDTDRLLVSSKTRKRRWNFELFSKQGLKWKSIILNIKPDGIYDGFVLTVQHLPNSPDKFQIIQYSSKLKKLQCFQQEDGSALFEYEVDDVTSLGTDNNGYIFITLYSGKIEILTPNGVFITSFQKAGMKRLKFSAFNEAKNKLFITTWKDSRIHILEVKRQLSCGIYL